MPAKPMTKGGIFLLQETPPHEIFTPEDFTSDQQLIAHTAREFIDKEVLPRIGEIETLPAGLNRQLLTKAGKVGLLMMDVPEEYGGMGLDLSTSMLVSETVGRSGGSFTATISDHIGIGTLPIIYAGSDYLRKKYLPKLATGELLGAYALTEPWSGSDAMGARASAVLSRNGRHYVLNGVKQFITNAGFSDLFTVFAKVDGQKFTSFVVEAAWPGVSTGQEEHKMGLKGSSTRQLILENVQVPVENVLGEVGRGHEVAFNMLNLGRLKLGAACVGAAKGLIETAVAYAKQRHQFGRPIASFGLIKHKISEMTLKTFVCESMVYRTTGLIDASMEDLDRMDSEYSQKAVRNIGEYAVECSMLKVYGSEALDLVVDEAVQIFGGYGFIEDYPVARAYRDSRINRIFEGTNEINRLLISETLLRRSLKGEIPFVEAARTAAGEILSPGTAQQSAGGKVLEEERGFLSQAKKGFLLCAGVAIQRYLDRIEEEQEVLGMMADMAMAIFATESCLLRTLKLIEKQGSEKCRIPILLSRLAMASLLEEINGTGRTLLATAAEGDELQAQLAGLSKLTRHTPTNAVALRRQVADHILEAEKYQIR
ncbi:MAG TPA: acyl-CoA dehydrogenase family protein [bacterium]|nr:acyl-CoA dehydrogenase family protein [bacterium]